MLFNTVTLSVINVLRVFNLNGVIRAPLIACKMWEEKPVCLVYQVVALIHFELLTWPDMFRSEMPEFWMWTEHQAIECKHNIDKKIK